MKKDIHLKLNKIKVKCQACDNVIETFSTKKTFSLDVCSKCHPFYSGNGVNAKALGRVDKFNKKYGINSK